MSLSIELNLGEDVRMETFATRGEWLNNRVRIGGSDAGSIIGVCPWRDNVTLWEEKTGRKEPADLSDNPLVEYGHNAEQYLRELFKLDFPQYEVCYEENNLWTNDKYPYAHASLDGWLVDGGGFQDTTRYGILEIKTATIRTKEQAQKWKGQIPQQYFAQVLHYLLVTEFDFAIVKAQLKYEMDEETFLVTKHYRIEREEVAEDIEYLRKKEEEFAELIEKDTRPSATLPEI